MIDSNSPNDKELSVDDIPEYTVPRGKTPHPDKTPLDPFKKRKLSRKLDQTPHTGVERDLLHVSDSIRHSKAVGDKNLSQTTQRGKSIESANINPNQEAMVNPAGFVGAKRAGVAQRNLQTHYQKWAQLCERYFSELRRMASENEVSSEDSTE